MGVKATAALTAMAAVAENRPADNPSHDTVAKIDDALSVAEKLSFFGNTTKSVKNGKADSGAFCSIPVCYTFPDKDTRGRVEQVFRSTCKASCATPYPQALRECIKIVLADGRRVRPEDFCSVSVDLPKLALRVSWRAKNTSSWTRYDKLIRIPEVVIESPNVIPSNGIQLENLPSSGGYIPTEGGAGGGQDGSAGGGPSSAGQPQALLSEGRILFNSQMDALKEKLLSSQAAVVQPIAP